MQWPQEQGQYAMEGSTPGEHKSASYNAVCLFPTYQQACNNKGLCPSLNWVNLHMPAENAFPSRLAML